MIKIVLDAGHGGSDPGAVYEGRQEKDDNLQLVFDVGAVLESHGIDVEYTRVTDVYQSPYEKAAMANQSGADFFVSIHRNARDIPNTEGGVETLLYSTEESAKRDMAEAINRNLEEIGFANRGVIARPNLVVLRDTDMPALLVEAGFLDSEADNALFDANQAAIADAIAFGILAGLQMEAQENLSAGLKAEVQETLAGIRPTESEANAQGSTEPPADYMGDQKENDRDFVEEKKEREQRNEPPKIYRVQAGVYRNPSNARMMLNRLRLRGHRAFLIFRNDLYYIQVGAFSDLNAAVEEEKRLKEGGFTTLLVTE